MNKQHIQKAFSGSAHRYDQHTALQQDIGRDLLADIPSRRDSMFLLDVGMGTGWMTQELQRAFPGAGVVGMDLAFGMAHFVRKNRVGIQAVQADAAHLPFKDNVFHLVVSNLAYQWVEDLSASFRQIYRVLGKDGELYVTLFTRETLWEMYESFQNAFPSIPGRSVPLTSRLPEGESVLSALQGQGFQIIRQQRQNSRRPFTDLLDLLRWLKAIGANTMNGTFFIGREGLAAADQYYKSQFKSQQGIQATFEVIKIVARKRELL